VDELVSDEERERTALGLRDHLLAGRLTLEEFSDRVESAYRARTSGELAAAATRLPAVAGAAESSRRRPCRFTAALFAHVLRRGRLRLERWTSVVSVFADVDLDLRQAVLAHGEVDVRVVALFGNVDVYVPEAVDVDVGGAALFGHRREWGRDAPAAGAPALRVRAFTLFGTVDVWRVPRELGGSYREVTRALQRGQRELPG
jgi:hypothetical protein